MPSHWYTRGLFEALKGNLALDGGATFKIALVDTTYVSNRDHKFMSDVTGELNGTGYTPGFAGSGRKTLTGRTVTQVDASDRVEADAADVPWTGINAGTVGGAVIYKEGTSDADSPLVVFLDITDITTNGGSFTFQFATNGYANINA